MTPPATPSQLSLDIARGSARDFLLHAFEQAFRGKLYRHRRATVGNSIAAYLYDDIYTLGRSPKFVEAVATSRYVVNTQNLVTGKKSRRGDGTFGELIPGIIASEDPNYLVKRGPVATLAIGTEMKIIATAMLRQIDRVMSDLENQARRFRDQNTDSICVGIVGLNYAKEYTGHEGKRRFVARVPPSREAPEVARRLDERVRSSYDEFLIIPFLATNRQPYTFAFLDQTTTQHEYRALVLRISNEFQKRF